MLCIVQGPACQPSPNESTSIGGVVGAVMLDRLGEGVRVRVKGDARADHPSRTSRNLRGLDNVRGSSFISHPPDVPPPRLLGDGGGSETNMRGHIHAYPRPQGERDASPPHTPIAPS